MYERREQKHRGSYQKLIAKKTDAPKFIKDFFFASKNGMHAESIIEQMKQNTKEFVEDVWKELEKSEIKLITFDMKMDAIWEKYLRSGPIE